MKKFNRCLRTVNSSIHLQCKPVSLLNTLKNWFIKKIFEKGIQCVNHARGLRN